MAKNKEKKSKKPLEEFEYFKSQREKDLLRWFLMGDVFFLIATLILMFISEEILNLGILTWPNYWILFLGNLIFILYFLFCLIKDFKVWILKYVTAVFSPLLIIGWIYFTDIQYVKILFIAPVQLIMLAGLLFYDTTVLFISALTTMIYMTLLFLHYFRSGVAFPLYEIYLTYMFCIVSVVFSWPLLQRTRIYLVELLEKRREAEEAKSVLEVKVQARTKELRELTQNLDQKVKARTTELQERVSQLERFQKLTIGRELKMVELKKEIEEKSKEIQRLKKELEKI